MNATQLIAKLTEQDSILLIGNTQFYYDSIVVRRISGEDHIVLQDTGLEDALSAEAAIQILENMPKNIEVWYELRDNSILPIHDIEIDKREHYIKFNTFF